MPKRVVDGEGLWRSKKLKRVKPEYRLHYANWIPMANHKGVFEADPDLIWTTIYAYLVPQISVDDVKQMIVEFKREDLLKVWEEDGKEWAYFVGIEKPGRLPSKTHHKRYTQDESPDPQVFNGIIRDSPGLSALGFGFGSGIGSGLGKDKSGRAQPTFEQVKAYCQERGNSVDPQKWFDHYQSNGWKVGKNPMKDWKAAIRTWERNGYDAKKATSAEGLGIDPRTFAPMTKEEIEFAHRYNREREAREKAASA